MGDESLRTGQNGVALYITPGPGPAAILVNRETIWRDCAIGHGIYYIENKLDHCHGGYEHIAENAKQTTGIAKSRIVRRPCGEGRIYVPLQTSRHGGFLLFRALDTCKAGHDRRISRLLRAESLDHVLIALIPWIGDTTGDIKCP